MPVQQAASQPETVQAATQAVADSKEITYEQILEKPDDAELNLAYAKTQVRRGDLKGAAGTLERMLMVNQDLHAVRLFYAVVLFRLDNLAETQRELDTLKKGKASPAVKAEAQTYLKAVKKRQQLTSVSGSLSAGVEYDSNRNAAPISDKRLFMDTPLSLTGLSKRRDDVSFLFIGSGEIRRVLSAQKRHEVFGGVSYFRADQDSVKTVNLQAISLKTGGTYKAGLYEFKPTLSYDKVLLQGEKFLLNSGAALRAERKLSKADDAYAEAKYAYQDNLKSKKIGSNPDRRGALYSAAVGAGRVITPVMKLGAELAYAEKGAKKNYNAFRSWGLTLRHSWLLGKGGFLLTSVSAGNDIYRQADAVISAKTRKDATFRAGLTGGLPVSGLHPKLRKYKDLTLSLTLEHFSSHSTLTNYTYENNKAVLLLGYRWNLGL
jgi:tetratricopeptide (TPR) repeat protein